MKKHIFLDFVVAINTHNLDKLCDLMTDNHVFIDSQDNRFSGKESMKQAWIAYFEIFPDYIIEAQEIVEHDSLVYGFGYASGTYKNLKTAGNVNFWKVPAAWRAVIADNKVM